MRKIHIEIKNEDETVLLEWNYLIYSKDKLKIVRIYSPKWELIEIDGSYFYDQEEVNLRHDGGSIRPQQIKDYILKYFYKLR